MYVIIEKIILYYIWIIYIIKNYYFKLFKEGGSAKHKLFLKGAVVVKVWNRWCRLHIKIILLYIK
jgi:hypothetical protein